MPARLRRQLDFPPGWSACQTPLAATTNEAVRPTAHPNGDKIVCALAVANACDALEALATACETNEFVLGGVAVADRRKVASE